MRLALVAVLALSGCGWDTSDLSDTKSSAPTKDAICTKRAHDEGHKNGYFDQDVYNACMYGTVDKPDSGTSD